ncbi:MAG: A/G-specific adenine glycosylase [Clostridia bacterium]
MNTETRKRLPDILLAWYDQTARVLPWRDDPTPYRVWVSEIMLQQTRVDAVMPYYENFMSHVPTLRDLAEIPLEKLLKLWEGLGYYSRAENLKKAAMRIMEEHEGELPVRYEDWIRLPGIGPYTAGAIASIACGQKTTAVDGNVLRVFSRLTADVRDITDAGTRKDIGRLVALSLPDTRTGDYNQALMELGATVCLPSGAPRCSICPVSSLCEAFHQGNMQSYPVKPAKKKRIIQKKTVLIIECEGKFALRQRPVGGLLPGLWEFPVLEGCLSVRECRDMLREQGTEIQGILPLDGARHVFTHLEWHMTAYHILVKEQYGPRDWIWASREQIRDDHAIASALKTYTGHVVAR